MTYADVSSLTVARLRPCRHDRVAAVAGFCAIRRSAHAGKFGEAAAVAGRRHSYDISKLTPAQQTIALRAMQRWTDTGAK
jgi:hypothetical protein